MPQPRKPTAILDAEGAFIRHPERSRESEPETSDKKPLGDAPAYLSEFQKEVWAQLSAQMLPGVCFESDRTSFELLVRLVCKMRTDTINRSDMIDNALEQALTDGVINFVILHLQQRGGGGQGGFLSATFSGIG